MLELLLSETKTIIPKVTTFKGEVTQANFLTFADLTTQVNLTAGTAINVDTAWIHFITKDGKDLYFPKMPIRKSITWEQLDSLGVVTGTKTVVIGGKTYMVRLLLCAPSSPGAYITGREWNEYIVNLTNGVYASYTPAQLGTGTGGTSNGEFNIGQELSANAAGAHVAASYRGVTELWYIPQNYVDAGYGWRPVLELV